jgi:transcriptional regulator with XRE-family HTH domain
MPIADIQPVPVSGAMRVLRNAKGISQKELGRLVGLSQSKIWQMENGYITPSPEQAIKIFGLLSTSR